MIAIVHKGGFVPLTAKEETILLSVLYRYFYGYSLTRDMIFSEKLYVYLKDYKPEIGKAFLRFAAEFAGQRVLLADYR